MGKLTVTIEVGNQQGEQREDIEVTVDTGWTIVRLEGQTFPSQVTFAEEGEPPLLGMVTLEEALLDVERLQQQAGRPIRRRRPTFGYPEPRCPQIQRGHDPAAQKPATVEGAEWELSVASSRSETLEATIRHLDRSVQVALSELQ